jgi:hypothetical protein
MSRRYWRRSSRSSRVGCANAGSRSMRRASRRRTGWPARRRCVRPLLTAALRRIARGVSRHRVGGPRKPRVAQPPLIGAGFESNLRCGPVSGGEGGAGQDRIKGRYVASDSANASYPRPTRPRRLPCSQSASDEGRTMSFSRQRRRTCSASCASMPRTTMCSATGSSSCARWRPASRH